MIFSNSGRNCGFKSYQWLYFFNVTKFCSITGWIRRIFLQNDVFDLESGNGRVASVYGFSIFLPTPPVVFSRSGGVCDRHNNDDARVVCGNWIYLAALLGTLAAMIWQLIICSQQQQLSFYFALLFMHDFFLSSVLLLHFQPFLRHAPHLSSIVGSTLTFAANNRAHFGTHFIEPHNIWESRNHMS